MEVVWHHDVGDELSGTLGTHQMWVDGFLVAIIRPTSSYWVTCSLFFPAKSGTPDELKSYSEEMYRDFRRDRVWDHNLLTEFNRIWEIVGNGEDWDTMQQVTNAVRYSTTSSSPEAAHYPFSWSEFVEWKTALSSHIDLDDQFTHSDLGTMAMAFLAFVSHYGLPGGRPFKFSGKKEE